MKMMNVLLLSSSIGFFIIGVHQLITLGIMHSYWIFMVTIALLFLYQLKKKAQ